MMQERATTASVKGQPIPGTAEETRLRLIEERRGVIVTMTGNGLGDANPEEYSQQSDLASVDHLRDVEYKHREALSRRLRLLDNALEKINAGAYGVCEICGSRIVAKRLASDPAVALCLRCQSASEGSTVTSTL